MKLFDKSGMRIRLAAVRNVLESSGLLLIEEGDIPTVENLLSTFSAPYHHPHENAPGLTGIEATGSPHLAHRPGLRGFSRDTLSPHTDRAMDADPPTLVTLLVIRAPDRGGQALLVDLAPALASIVEFVDFREVSRAAVLRSATREQPILEIQPMGHYRFRYRDDEVARPYALNPQGIFVLKEMGKRIKEAQVTEMRSGEGYIIHNHRYLHGRRSFDGHRTVVRFLAKADLPVRNVEAPHTRK